MVEDNKTKIPAHLDEERPLLVLAELKLSMRQGLTVIISGVVWMVLIQLVTFILPIGNVFAGLLFSWVLIVGLFLTFAKKEGRPYEEHLSHRVAYWLSPKQWGQVDPKAKYGEVEEAQFTELDDEESLLPPPQL